MRLRQDSEEPLPASHAAFGISGGRKAGGLRGLLMSHPPIEERIEALRAAASPRRLRDPAGFGT